MLKPLEDIDMFTMLHFNKNVSGSGCQPITILDMGQIKYNYNEVPYRYITTKKDGEIIVYGAASYYIEKCNNANNISASYITVKGQKCIYGFTEFILRQSMVSDFQLWMPTKIRSYDEECGLFGIPDIDRTKRSYTYTAFIAGIDELGEKGGRFARPGRRGFYSIEELIEAFQNLSKHYVINLTRADHYGKYCEYRRYDITQNDPRFFEILGIQKILQQQ